MASKNVNKAGAFIATGRRKKSIARVRLYPGTGVITINGRNIEDYLQRDTLIVIAKQPLVLTDTASKFDVVVNVEIPDGYRILSVIEFDVGALDSITLTQIRIDNVDKNITIGLCNTTEYQFTKSMYLDILFVRNNFISNAN